ncbi:MAG: hypothetical protein WCR55_06535 [Lentisphaerota bacterium]
MKKFIFVLSMAVVAICSGCQNPQEDDGVSPLPQNRPSAAELKMGSGMPLKY